jgi:hypothetical protein
MNSTLNRILWLISLTAGFSAVVLFSYLDEQFGLGLLYRVLILLGLLGISLGGLSQTNFGKNATKLISESRIEIEKGVGLSRGETTKMKNIVLGRVLVLAQVFWGQESWVSI